MKLNRRELRRLIESVINEENPGSKFAAAEKKGEKNKNEAEIQKATQELQKTYDWYVNTVFPSIEENDFPIVVNDTYHHGFIDGMLLFPIKKGDKINGLDDVIYKLDSTEYTLAEFYKRLEYYVIKSNLRVTMQSEQPDEFEELVAKAKKDNPSNNQVNESLSRGSLYRRRYHGRY